MSEQTGPWGAPPGGPPSGQPPPGYEQQPPPAQQAGDFGGWGASAEWAAPQQTGTTGWEAAGAWTQPADPQAQQAYGWNTQDQGWGTAAAPVAPDQGWGQQGWEQPAQAGWGTVEQAPAAPGWEAPDAGWGAAAEPAVEPAAAAWGAAAEPAVEPAAAAWDALNAFEAAPAAEPSAYANDGGYGDGSPAAYVEPPVDYSDDQVYGDEGPSDFEEPPIDYSDDQVYGDEGPQGWSEPAAVPAADEASAAFDPLAAFEAEGGAAADVDAAVDSSFFDDFLSEIQAAETGSPATGEHGESEVPAQGASAAAYADDGAAYGDDPAAYADSPAAYADDGVAYGDDPAAYADSQTAYADSPAAYADDGVAYGDSPAAYADSPAAYADSPAAYADDGVAYGDDPAAYADSQTAYADSPAAYADDGVAYGDSPAAYADSPAAYADSPAAYADDGVAYGDDPAAYADTPTAYADHSATDYAEAVLEAGVQELDAAALWEDGVERDQLEAPRLWDDGVERSDDEPASEVGDEPEPSVAPAARKLPVPMPSGRALVVAGAGVALLGGLGVGGYLIANSDVSVPGVDVKGALKSLPFFGESAATIAQHKENAKAVEGAIQAYAADRGKLPPTPGAIELFLAKNEKQYRNPYDPEEPLLITFGEKPEAPGAVSVQFGKADYVIRVAGKDGKPLEEDEQQFAIKGVIAKLAEALPAESPAPDATPAPRPSAGTAEPLPSPGASVPAPPKVARPGPWSPDYMASHAGTTAVQPAYPPPIPLVLLVRPPGGPTLPALPPEPVPTPMPSYDLTNVSANAVVERNREFDRHRLRGIALIYESRTIEALEEFKKAAAIRPDDVTTMAWLARVQEVVDKAEGAAREKAADGLDAALRARDMQIRQQMESLNKGQAAQPVDDATAIDRAIRERMAEVGRMGQQPDPTAQAPGAAPDGGLQPPDPPAAPAGAAPVLPAPRL